MSLATLLLVALSLSVDAFGACAARGAARGRLPLPHRLRVAAVFGGFACLGPLIGWAVGHAFHAQVAEIDHWIAFALLAGLGGKMIWDALATQPDADVSTGERLGVLLAVALATSIDSIAVGISLPMMDVAIALAAPVIGAVTLGAALAGLWLGAFGGRGFGPRAELIGGGLLMLIGLRILITHLIAGAAA